LSEELELKYSISDPPAVEAWLDEQLPGIDGATGWRDRTISDLYFDTADGALAAAGYGARLRRTGEDVVVALKGTSTASGAFHLRRELEAPAVDSLLTDEWPASDVRELVRSVCRERPLVERFVLHQRRREREAIVEGARLLISLDNVQIRSRGHVRQTLRGMEIELLAGPPAALDEVARRLAAGGLAEPEPSSKMEIAGRLTDC
jgi:triphosphatase